MYSVLVQLRQLLACDTFVCASGRRHHHRRRRRRKLKDCGMSGKRSDMLFLFAAPKHSLLVELILSPPMTTPRRSQMSEPCFQWEIIFKGSLSLRRENAFAGR